MERNLTQGSISRSLILFSLPMILGNLIQQLYNVADTLIVGKTIGPTALSAVGSSYSLMTLLTSVILGLCMGSGVVFSHLYGAGRREELRTAVFNAFFFVLVVSAVLNAGAFALLERLLVWLNIPAEAVDYTREYLSIIFVGMSFVSLYNFLAAVLRSIGDTAIPLLFLAVSAVTNIVLDLVFILRFGMGVGGAAWATVLAQGLSAVCMAVYFLLRARELRPRRSNMHLDRRLLHLIFSNSVLTAVQQSIMNLGILMVQGLVNSFGFAVSAAFAAVVKIDAFAYMPAQDFGNAFATFVAQNYGAGKGDRIRQGLRTALKLSGGFCILSSACVALLARPLMLLFIEPEETEIIAVGVTYLHIEGVFYIGIGILFLLYALYRGLGRPEMSIVLTVVSLGTRVALAYALSALPAVGLVGIWWSVPIGWALADLLGLWYYRRRRKTLLPE